MLVITGPTALGAKLPALSPAGRTRSRPTFILHAHLIPQPHFMQINPFISRCKRHCTRYFDAVRVASREGKLVDSDGRPVQPMYPSILLVCDTPTHVYGELLGGTSSPPTSLQVVRRSLPSTRDLLGMFPSASTGYLFNIDGRRIRLAHLALLSKRDRDAFTGRYPELADMHDSTLVYDGSLDVDDAFHPICLADDSDLWLDDVLTVASWRGQVRARYFQSAWLIERDASSSELQRRFDYHHPIGGPETGLLTPAVKSQQGSVVRAANFASLSSVDKIGETTITKFLEYNEQILLTALDGVSLIPQPYLVWQEGNQDTSEIAIQPDFMVVDREGEGHVCEVKLPLLERTSLTTGGHRRRRFVNAVTEGIAQLANYREFLSYDRHCRAIYDAYGITIKEPRVILLVGSADNYDPEEVRQAQRMLQPFELIDYDSLRALYLLKSGYVPGEGT